MVLAETALGSAASWQRLAVSTPTDRMEEPVNYLQKTGGTGGAGQFAGVGRLAMTRRARRGLLLLIRCRCSENSGAAARE
jgi:hypothetical protein